MLCEITYDEKDDEVAIIGDDFNTLDTVEIRVDLDVFMAIVNGCLKGNKLPYTITKV